mgnify:FL=1
MSFPVIIIFLVLLLWFVICLPLLRLFYLESKLSKVYDMVVLLSLCASMVLTFIVVGLLFAYQLIMKE